MEARTFRWKNNEIKITRNHTAIQIFPDGLTIGARDLRILYGVAEGMTHRQIGRDLGLSHRTVSNRLDTLRRQSGRSTMGLVTVIDGLQMLFPIAQIGLKDIFTRK